MIPSFNYRAWSLRVIFIACFVGCAKSPEAPNSARVEPLIGEDATSGETGAEKSDEEPLSLPIVLVPDRVSEEFGFPSENGIVAGESTNVDGTYQVELFLNRLIPPFAGICWNLSRSIRIPQGSMVEFEIAPKTKAAYQFKFERKRAQDGTSVLLRRLDVSEQFQYVRISRDMLKPEVAEDLYRICIAIEARSNPGTDVVRFQLGKVVLRNSEML